MARNGQTPRDPSDEQLWARARHGDPAAFGELFTRHSSTVYTFCFRLTASWKTAEDLTTVVFLEAWRQRDDVPDDHVLSWLLGLAARAAEHSTRAVRRHRSLLAKLPPAVIDSDRSGDASLDTERQMTEILRVFKRLPKREQEVLALCMWGERTPAEAAIALGIPVGTARSRLTRAHEHLSRLLGADAAGDEPSRPSSREADQKP